MTPEIADALRRLKGLRDRGVLSEEEFAAQKADLLATGVQLGGRSRNKRPAPIAQKHVLLAAGAIGLLAMGIVLMSRNPPSKAAAKIAGLDSASVEGAFSATAPSRDVRLSCSDAAIQFAALTCLGSVAVLAQHELGFQQASGKPVSAELEAARATIDASEKQRWEAEREIDRACANPVDAQGLALAYMSNASHASEILQAVRNESAFPPSAIHRWCTNIAREAREELPTVVNNFQLASRQR
ncbi:SHOCT domain-containing protein [Phenylobacterium sp. 58.2.17]|uniref:SHOCT domain-containing protein n=1 Tax=Phenylobacterium sp. 58.2.17 TaxID=2969306 RepID=UPI0022654AEF|nr:SHOCT domain-containing protein [Phenylobacterium sp. 58.2.17]MCX7584882.1 SHOCT domain-containing protein [Phenylobacterium sp. 58.2.17]